MHAVAQLLQFAHMQWHTQLQATVWPHCTQFLSLR